MAAKGVAGKDPPELEAAEKVRLRKLEIIVENIRLAFNKNHLAYTDAISMMDGHVSVLRAVINDVHRDVCSIREMVDNMIEDLYAKEEGQETLKVQKETTVDANGEIDWDAYYEMFNKYLEEERAKEKTPTEASPSMEPVTAVEIFGGDYGGGTRQVSEIGTHTNSAAG